MTSTLSNAIVARFNPRAGQYGGLTIIRDARSNPDRWLPSDDTDDFRSSRDSSFDEDGPATFNQRPAIIGDV